MDADSSCSAGPRAAGQSEILPAGRRCRSLSQRKQSGRDREGDGLLSIALSVRRSVCVRGGDGCERTHGSLEFLWSRHTEGVHETGFRCLLCDPILIAEIEFMYIFIFF